MLTADPIRIIVMTADATEIEPAQSPEETVLKFRGKARRTTLKRMSYAECEDPDCDMAWYGVSSMGSSGQHVVGTGHKVIQYYEAAYRMQPHLVAPRHNQSIEEALLTKEKLRNIAAPHKKPSKVTTKKAT